MNVYSNVTTIWSTGDTDAPGFLDDIQKSTQPRFMWAWIALPLLLVVLNLKSLPFAWHFRITNAFSYVLRSQRLVPKDGKLNVFDAVITESLSPPFECDFNLHKSNSTYFSDVDIARTNLICTLFNRGIEDARFASPVSKKVDKNAQLTAMVAGVSCTFKGEIKPFQRYLMWSRILCWDQKWFWMVTWFVAPRESKSKDGKTKERKVFATAVSKCVWKKSRMTIQPEVMMKLSGLIPSKAAELTDGKNAEAPLPTSPLPEAESQRRSGLKLLESEDALERLHNSFRADSSVLARRHALDFSPLLILRIGVLFVEWVVDRFLRMLRQPWESV